MYRARGRNCSRIRRIQHTMNFSAQNASLNSANDIEPSFFFPQPAGTVPEGFWTNGVVRNGSLELSDAFPADVFFVLFF